MSVVNLLNEIWLALQWLCTVWFSSPPESRNRPPEAKWFACNAERLCEVHINGRNIFLTTHLLSTSGISLPLSTHLLCCGTNQPPALQLQAPASFNHFLFLHLPPFPFIPSLSPAIVVACWELLYSKFSKNRFTLRSTIQSIRNVWMCTGECNKKCYRGL